MPQIGAHTITYAQLSILQRRRRKNNAREIERNRARGTEKANKGINKKENMGNTRTHTERVRLKQLKEWPITIYGVFCII